MVRKDVKIGAVVLAILIAVIVVYVLVVPSAPPAVAEGGSLDDEAFKKQLAAREAADAGKPAGPVSRPEAPVVAGAGTPTAGPTDPFADTNEKWMLALNTGVVPQKKVSPAGSPIVPPTTTPGGIATRRLEPAPGSSAASTDTPRAPVGVRTHIVQPGDSIARIAESVYGSQVHYKAILEANPGVNPTKLKPGMTLVIPDVKEVKGRGGSEDTTPAPAVDSKTEYVVVAGDSMHKIAMKLYGKSEMWEDIYQLNRAKIGDDPAKLKLGMVLKLPSPPTGR